MAKPQLAPDSTTQTLPPVIKVEEIEQFHLRNVNIMGYSYSATCKRKIPAFAVSVTDYLGCTSHRS